MKLSNWIKLSRNLQHSITLLWICGYVRRLMYERSWVSIPATNLCHIYLCVKLYCFFKRQKINKKMPIEKRSIMIIVWQDKRQDFESFLSQSCFQLINMLIENDSNEPHTHTHWSTLHLDKSFLNLPTPLWVS